MSKIFLSHSHQDKLIARRIVRFLRAYGLEPWLDVRELRLGNRLDEAIRKAILESDAVVVVATNAAAHSKWVEREVTFANDASPTITVCPVYVDDVTTHPSFAPHLGIDAGDRHQFADVLLRLTEAFVGSPLPQPDREQLEAGLEELSQQSPGIALLVESCVRGVGLRYEHVQLVSEVSFHELDEALHLISLMGGGSDAAAATAALFARTGAGSAAVSRYMLAGHNILGSAVGVELDPKVLDAAFRLLSLPKPSDDQSLAAFLFKNSEALAAKYRAEVVRLVTHPDRGPAGFGADAAAAAFRVFPDNDDLVMLWSRWIREGLFDSLDKPGADEPKEFAYWCAEGLRTGAAGWSKVFESFTEHVRRLARTKSEKSVRLALKHMMVAADQKNPRVAEIVRECSAAIGAGEWDGWEERDRMSTYVSAYTEEALGQLRWSEAERRASESWEAIGELHQAISEQENSGQLNSDAN